MHSMYRHSSHKNTPYMLYYCSRDTNCTPFRSIMCVFLFQDILKVVENRKCTEWPKNINHLTVKGDLYALTTYPRGPLLVHFALRTAIFVLRQTTRLSKTEQTQTDLQHLTVKSAPHALSTTPWGPKVGQFRATVFKIWHIVAPVNCPPKRTTQKKKISKF